MSSRMDVGACVGTRGWRTSRSRSSGVLLGLVALLVLAAPVPPVQSATGEEPPSGTAGSSRSAERGRPVEGQYIVEFKPGTTDPKGRAQRIARENDGVLLHTYEHALLGFAARLHESKLAGLRRNPNIARIEQDQVVVTADTQGGATWGLDRIDQRTLPLDGSYTHHTTGRGVHAYVLDTGVRLTHAEFAGRIGAHFDAVTTGGTADDCHGHGTHVAGTLGGTVHGVAKGVTVHPVRVLDCQGSGTTAGVIAGVDWVTANHQEPAVANMSLGGDPSPALDTAVSRSVDAGVTYVVAAGNSTANACGYSPARVPSALTVGSTTRTDARSSFSNHGSCLDLFAPGTDITSAWRSGDTATHTISGTSMASPHVAGVAALVLEPEPTLTPAQVRDDIVLAATAGALSGIGSGSPDLLLHSTTSRALDDAYASDEDLPLHVEAPGVLANDTGPSASGALSTVLVTQPAHGVLVLQEDGSFDYTPAADFSGTDSFSYRAARGQSGRTTNAATVVLTVRPVNDAPVITSVTGATGPVPAGTLTQLTTSFSDVDTGDTHACTVDWGDGQSSTVPASAQECSASHAYSAAGVYTPVVTVADAAGAVATRPHEFVVVYDPEAGHVTGGGWIHSPAGAYALQPTAEGRASFGFVSAYRRGASTPDGNTSFRFAAGDLTFRSDAYQWLVVSGPKAQYKGTGVVNGLPGFSFLLTATDGDRAGGGGSDRFRIKVWDSATGAVVYDNVPGAPDSLDGADPQVLGGGAITIHDGTR